MKRPTGVFVLPAVLSVVLLTPLPGRAVEHKYIEDFTTARYKDVANTTARWDTVAGELRLFPFVPTLAGTCDTPDASRGVAVTGDYACMADNASGLQVIDVSDPTNPVIVGTCDTPGTARAVCVSGIHAFVADGLSGLQVIDISDPASPTLVGTCDTPDHAFGIAVSGNHAFVGDYGSGLQVIDITDPANPTLVGAYDTPAITYGVAISGDHAFVAVWDFGLFVFDISNPTNPTLVATCDTPSYVHGVTISGDYAFVADRNAGLQVVDISDPATPTIVGNYDTSGFSYGVVVSGDRAYVADHSSGLQVIDISDPTDPTLVGNYDTPDLAYGVVLSGEHAFVADYTTGLQVIEISEPVSPTLVGACNTPSPAFDIALSGDHVFVADFASGLRVIDITDPTNPTSAGSCDTPGLAHRVEVSGNYAFVADQTSGLQVIDIADPANPTLVATYDTPGYAYGVAVSGDHVFVADFYPGVHVIDVANPVNPVLVGTCNTPDAAFDVAVSGDYVFVADWTSGLQVIDVTNPSSPTLVGTCDTPDYAEDVAVSGGYVFVADATSGIQVIDVTNPTSPTLVGTCDTPGTADAIALSGNYAFVADYAFGLQVIDITDPTNPVLVETCHTPGDARGIVATGEHAFVADYGAGLQVLRVFQSEFDTDHNIGRSLAIDASNGTIRKSRLVTTQTNTVLWDLSLDGGSSWQRLEPTGIWTGISASGTDLFWRSTHAWAAPGVSPSVSHLEIDWLYDAASSDSIVDVPDDQGKWVRVHFTRSASDFADEEFPVTYYGVWQRVDAAALLAAVQRQASSITELSAASRAPALGGLPVVTNGGRTFVQSGPDIAATSFPPGTWEWVATVPAVQQDTYIARVATVEDSSATGPNYAVFVLTAHTTTPSIWYVSEPDSGYSVDNIAPGVPSGFAVVYHTGSGNHLTWDPSADEDFQYFKIYRGTSLDFVPAPENLADATAATEWTDPNHDSGGVFYRITALDYAGNESAPASFEPPTGVGDEVIPNAFALYQNVPNPFNPETVIRYDVPAGGGKVNLLVFDVSGRLVRTLVNGMEPAGQRTVRWNGTNDGGDRVASGIYFYRMTAPGYEERRKMVFLQ